MRFTRNKIRIVGPPVLWVVLTILTGLTFFSWYQGASAPRISKVFYAGKRCIYITSFRGWLRAGRIEGFPNSSLNDPETWNWFRAMAMSPDPIGPSRRTLFGLARTWELTTVGGAYCWGFCMPHWLICGLFAAPSILFGALSLRSWGFLRFRPGHCPHCSYNLTGNVSGICPECGKPILKPKKYLQTLVSRTEEGEGRNE